MYLIGAALKRVVPIIEKIVVFWCVHEKKMSVLWLIVFRD